MSSTIHLRQRQSHTHTNGLKECQPNYRLAIYDNKVREQSALRVSLGIPFSMHTHFVLFIFFK